MVNSKMRKIKFFFSINTFIQHIKLKTSQSPGTKILRLPMNKLKNNEK